MACAFFVKSVGVAAKFGKLANSNSFLSVEIRLRHVRRVRNRPRPGVSLYRKLNTWNCPEKGFAAKMNAQSGEVLFILVCFPVYRWSGMLAKCQKVAWSGPRLIWTPRSGNLVFRAYGRILRPPTAQIRRMGSGKSNDEIKNITAPPASAYSSPKKLKKSS